MIAQRLAPQSVDDARRILRECYDNSAAVQIEGGSTLHAMGSPAERTGVVVSTLRINDLLAHEYHDLTCSVQAGMRVADFDDRLAQHGQFVPLDAPLRRKATVGGTLASGWLSPRRHLYARSRDLVIGSQVVLADGTLANAGGMVVKNVTGYDMSKLYVGSFGTLGVITQANFKTLPIPQCRRVLLASLPERTRARAVEQIAVMSVPPAAAFCIEGFRKHIDGEDGVDGRVFILLEGSQVVVDRATRDMRSALGRAGVPETAVIDTSASESFERVLDACITSLGERSVTFRVLGDPSSAQDRAVEFRDATHRHELFTDVLFDVMNGDLFLRVSERDSRAFAEKVEACDDDLRALQPRRVIVAGDAPIRSSLDSWGQPPPAIEKMQALKTQFDPRRILNPGRFIGAI